MDAQGHFDFKSGGEDDIRKERGEAEFEAQLKEEAQLNKRIRLNLEKKVFGLSNRMDKFKNKYRISSARAPFWDYGGFGAYFVTLCTQNRICWFGDVNHEKMKLSDIGEIAQSEWLKTFKMRPDMDLWVAEYVVMPNHLHAIIGIGDNEYNTQTDTKTGTKLRDAMHCVSSNPTDPTKSTNPNTTTEANNHRPKNQFGPQSKNLASIYSWI